MKLDEIRTVGGVLAYIDMHERQLGFRPAVIGLPYGNYIAVIKEMGGDGRCTNLKANISGIPLVEI